MLKVEKEAITNESALFQSRGATLLLNLSRYDLPFSVPTLSCHEISILMWVGRYVENRDAQTLEMNAFRYSPTYGIC